ncbi:hypothetical protein DVH24_018455 [Malus domestica]|uniref:DNA-directed RNA polymerase n=1 Tax=Malus domestica TaxID=3750 RepID=A0A498KM70_MALDO|nr:hypothetical protein DVH24_018455 [Malus domestica]
MIQKGEHLSGTLCKDTLGMSTHGPTHVIWKECGPDAACKFLGNAQLLVHYWFLHNAYSIGIGDTIVDPATTEKIKQTISEAKDELGGLISIIARSKQLEAEPGRTLVDSFENKVNQVLNRARDNDKVGSSAEKSLSEMNNLKAMVTTGSKENFIKMSQMIACVGHQNIEGKRTLYGLINHLPLPHFTEDDYGPECRGGLFGTPKKPLRLASDMHLKESVEAIDKLQGRLKGMLSYDGLKVSYRHLAILCDAMTWSGFIRPIGKEDKRWPPLVQLFVEYTIDNVIHTAAYAKTYYIRGVLLVMTSCKLNISRLLDLTCETLADMITSKTPDIRKTFNDQHQERLLHPKGRGGRSSRNQ